METMIMLMMTINNDGDNDNDNAGESFCISVAACHLLYHLHQVQETICCCGKFSFSS